jgi:hypothetical protein
MAIVGSNETVKNLSSQIESQFPGFIREEGPQFVGFLKAYFEYLEQSGNSVHAIRSLKDNQDIDRTVDSFVEYFRREFMKDIPKDALADQRLLTKHIRQFYRARGTPEAYRFLFRALYNKEIEFYYPGDDILRVSDGRWLKESKLRVGEPFSINPTRFGGIQVTGATSGATAVVQNVVSVLASGVTVYDMTVENVVNGFQDGERIFDADGNFATVNAQIGALTDITVTSGGAFHNSGDEVEIGGASSTVNARGVVSSVTDTSALTARLVKSGSGYTRNNTRVLVTGGNGTGFEVGIHSFNQESINLSLNTDIIGSLKDVALNANSFFVRGGANTATVNIKLTGTVKAFTTTNTVFGQGTAFSSQLTVGDVVRIVGSPTALVVHSIGGAQTFVTTTRSSVNITTGANAYSKLAAANVTSTLASSLSYSNANFFTINALSIISPGSGYTSLPTIQIIDDEISRFNYEDGFGGFLGKNAAAVANTATGSILTVRITDRGTNFNKFQEANIINTTQNNDEITLNYPALSANGAVITGHTIRNRTYDGTGFGTVSGVTNYPGKYVDTKGFLSWNNRLQDNFYYQEFSYVIRVSELLEKYREVVKKLVHPSGTKLFGDYQIKSIVDTPIIIGSTRTNIFTDALNETITSNDDVVGRLIISAAVTTESVTLADSAITAGVVTFVDSAESITLADSLDAITLAVGNVSESISSTDSTNATYVSVALTSGTESISAADSTNGTYVSVGLTSGTESISAADSTNATYVSVGLTSGTESVTTIDSVASGVVTSATTNTESITTDDSIDNVLLLGASVSESISVSDIVVGTFVTNVSITENNGEITPYEDIEITTFQTVLIGDVVNVTLNLDDFVN